MNCTLESLLDVAKIQEVLDTLHDAVDLPTGIIDCEAILLLEPHHPPGKGPALDRGFLIRAVPEFNRAGRLESVLMVANDISELKRTQNELLKSQKLESLGVMAGGIAHDFNNILCGITGYIAMALQLVDPQSQISKHLQ